jgi:low affinity Fe/Cu permease
MSAIIIPMIFNKLVNISDNWHLMLHYPITYLLLVFIGLVGVVFIQTYGSWIILEQLVEKRKYE